MDLVDRYVYAVKRHLPAAQQEDIGNELTDDILSQMRDKEDEAGHALTEQEQVAVLKQYGHPYLLAMRYRTPRYLIGPVLFPFYVPALKIALALAFVIDVIASIVAALAAREPERMLGHILAFPGIAVYIVVAVTIAFAIADYWQAKVRLFDTWSPRSLPRVAAGARPPKPAGLIIEVVSAVIFVAWWLAVPAYPFLMLGPAAAFLRFTPAFSQIFYVVLIPSIASTLLAMIILARPTVAWLPRVKPLVANVLGLYVISAVMNAGDLIAPVKDTPELAQLVKGINSVTTIVLVVLALIVMAQIFVDIVRLLRSPSA